jgi:hypothetical protein
MTGIALFDLGDYAGATRELTTYLQSPDPVDGIDVNDLQPA